MTRPVEIAPGVRIGDGGLALIAGPCVIESRELVLEVAGRLKEACGSLAVPFVFKASLDKLAKTNINLAPKPIDFDSEGAARLALLRKCAQGSFQLADPDGTLIDVEEDH